MTLRYKQLNVSNNKNVKTRHSFDLLIPSHLVASSYTPSLWSRVSSLLLADGSPSPTDVISDCGKVKTSHALSEMSHLCNSQKTRDIWRPEQNLARHWGHDPLMADSHIACRAHAAPLPCRAAKGLECVFPI